MAKDFPHFYAKGIKMTANDNQPNPDRSEQQRIAVLEAFAERLVKMNISVNARYAMPDGGDLTFSTRNVFLNDLFCNIPIGIHPGHHVLLTISDTGVGIDSDTLTHIFEPFYTTKKPGNGTGIGLAMVYGIVKNHNGYILCQSEKDQGSTFQIYFPVIEEERMHHQGNNRLETIPHGLGTHPQTARERAR